MSQRPHFQDDLVRMTPEGQRYQQKLYELKTTFEDHLKVLENLSQTYIQPFTSKDVTLPANKFVKIFPNFEELVRLNQVCPCFRLFSLSVFASTHPTWKIYSPYKSTSMSFGTQTPPTSADSSPFRCY